LTTYVSLDLETTGTDLANDEIIEIGAVKFDENGIIDRFETFVRPGRSLPQFIQELTGIGDNELLTAPALESVVLQLEEFLADSALVGHHIVPFDVPFLRRAQVRHSEIVLDTYQLARLLLPGVGEYRLASLSALFDITNPRPHRALADAETTMEVFQALRMQAALLPASVLSRAILWLAGSSWHGKAVLQEALAQTSRGGAVTGSRPAPETDKPLERARATVEVPQQEAVRVLASAHDRPDILPQFEDRPEQVKMLEAVAAALNLGQRLIIEAGTGTGKSLAYLVPLALHSIKNGSRGVISTNTINLQQQLMLKDVPILNQLLETTGYQPARVTTLKGRRNYLCLNRFATQEPSLTPVEEEARFLARLTVWLAETQTGDRAELRLNRDEEGVWRRLSAEDSGCTANNCPYIVDGSCYLVRARRRAEASHLVITNHALLLTDSAMGGYLLPAWENLVIDEAHHLENQATQAFGCTTGERDIKEWLEACGRLLARMIAAQRRVGRIVPDRSIIPRLLEAAALAVEGCEAPAKNVMTAAQTFLELHAETSEYDRELRINAAMRAQPDWSTLEVAWDALRATLERLIELLDRLRVAGAADFDRLVVVNRDSLVLEMDNLYAQGRELVEAMAVAIERDDPERIVWLRADSRGGGITFSAAPLQVSSLLEENLYADKNAVILTGATLATGGDDPLAYSRRRLGLDDGEEIILGSSLGVEQAALVLVASDMPEPDSELYVPTLAATITGLVGASEGRALCLFTSHASLAATAQMVAEPLAAAGIRVLAQGIDGTAEDVIYGLRRDPRSVAFGAASLWEGIDVAGEALSLLIIARLPFSVPSEPVFAARAELYEDPFAEYALPQATLRFKQGFGRLIRTRTDRGVMAVLDSRIRSKRYGQAFLEALPKCAIQQAPRETLPPLVTEWLKGSQEPA